MNSPKQNSQNPRDNKREEDNEITPQEEELLDEAGMPATDEDEDLDEMALDEPEDMNESADPIDMGEDLDVPGSDLDDADEAIGEEDEENNAYSQPD